MITKLHIWQFKYVKPDRRNLFYIIVSASAIFVMRSNSKFVPQYLFHNSEEETSLLQLQQPVAFRLRHMQMFYMLKLLIHKVGKKQGVAAVACVIFR